MSFSPAPIVASVPSVSRGVVRTFRRIDVAARREVVTLWHELRRLDEVSTRTRISLTKCLTILKQEGEISRLEAAEIKLKAMSSRHAARRDPAGRITAELERRLQARSGGMCECCRALGREGVPGKIRDHIVPVENGGVTELRNLRFICDEHNALKSHFFDRMVRARVIAHRARARFATAGMFRFNAMASILERHHVQPGTHTFADLRACREDFYGGDHLLLKKDRMYKPAPGEPMKSGQRQVFLKNAETAAWFRHLYHSEEISRDQAPTGVCWDELEDFTDIVVEKAKRKFVTQAPVTAGIEEEMTR